MDSSIFFKMENNFNDEIYKLPDSILELTFGNEFNKQIGIDILPKSLKKIIFGLKFNKRLHIYTTIKTNVINQFSINFNQ